MPRAPPGVRGIAVRVGQLGVMTGHVRSEVFRRNLTAFSAVKFVCSVVRSMISRSCSALPTRLRPGDVWNSVPGPSRRSQDLSLRVSRLFLRSTGRSYFTLSSTLN
ncbi:hypothetical protein EDF62_2236 [Leucobacter luti]|uniref:Uncharacterized protein n=1 Tax=Leucobacter luti TaxID=340320 RepID=A0A4R6RYF6_9MICO|nr:hypothetical protein EDF62_2236 [Leucobacter luti]